jgi:hypothetical protein
VLVVPSAGGLSLHAIAQHMNASAKRLTHAS